MRFAICAAAVLVVSCTAFGAEAKAEGTYELHEWGVFSVPRSDAWAQRDMRQEWASFPKFFNRVWPDTNLPHRGSVRKPVIYFHATAPVQVQLKVRFAEGRPLVWWPPSQYPGGGIPMKDLDRVEWYFSLLKLPNEQQTPDPMAVDKGHWVEALRSVKSSPVYAYGGHDRMAGGGLTAEQFVYYDGIMKAPAAPKVSRDGEAVVLETEGGHVFLDLMVVERTEKGVRVAKTWSDWNVQVETKKLDTRIQMVAAAEDDLKRLRKELADRLTKAGLNADEAESLAAVWNDGLFKNDGLTIFYRVPQETYEKWLPLEAKPAPTKTVRVGLVLHEHLEPELDARVEGLIKKLGAEAFETRNAAQAELTKIGGAAFPALEKAAQGEDAEISKACRAILTALDAAPALKVLGKP